MGFHTAGFPTSLQKFCTKMSDFVAATAWRITLNLLTRVRGALHVLVPLLRKMIMFNDPSFHILSILHRLPHVRRRQTDASPRDGAQRLDGTYFHVAG